MKKLVYFCLAIYMALCIIGCQPSPDGYDIEGKPFSLSAYRGKWVIVNYWAPWCSPCLKELPELNAFYLSHKDNVVVLGVSFDDLSSQVIQNFAQKNQIDFPLIKQFAKEKWGIDHLSTLPVTLIFSPRHKLIKILNGPQTQNNLLKILSK